MKASSPQTIIGSFKDWPSRMKSLVTNPKWVIDTLLSAVMAYSLGIGIMYWVLDPLYANLTPTPINDRLLNILGPAIDLNFPSAIGLFFVASTFALYVLWKMPEKIPFILKAFAIAAFSKHLIGPITNLTQPLGAIKDWAYDDIYNDLFFSGHTANTFFAYLLVRKNTKVYKYIVAAGCIFEIACVLLMKLHYTIDVFAAPFIAFGMFTLAKRFFGKNKTEYEKLLPAGSDIRTVD